MMRLLLRFTSALFVLAVNGCSAEDQVDSVHVDPVPIRGCEDQQYQVCDVLEQTCQQAVFDLVKCLRKDNKAPLPYVRKISEQDYRDDLEQSQAKREADQSAVDKQRQQAYEQALELLGLIAPGDLSTESKVQISVSNVVAYYSDATKQVTLIDRGKELDSLEVVATLAHEFGHALQDREFDLNAFFDAYSNTLDQSLAARALVEGDADLYASLIECAIGGLDVEQLDLLTAFQARAVRSENYALKQSAPFASSYVTFPYGMGRRYAYLAWQDFDAEKLRAQFADPPRTTQRLLASIETLAEPTPTDTIDALQVDERLTLYVDTSLGAWNVLLYIAKTNRVAADALALAWRGDRFSVYDGADGTGVIWRLRFATPGDAQQFAALSANVLPSTTQQRVVDVRDAEVKLVVASTKTTLDQLEAVRP